MKLIIATIASTLLMAGAYAQAPMMKVSASPAVMADVDANLKVGNHIRELHAKLHITAAEEGPWSPVAEAMRDAAANLESAVDQRKAGMASASAVDDLNAYANIAEAHAAGVKKVADAFGPLYAAMSDEQKQLADEMFTERVHHAAKKAAVAVK